METLRRVAKNTAVLLAASVISSVFYVSYMASAARHLGPSGFGILSFSLAFAGIFGIFTDFGFRALAVREVARERSLAAKYLVNVAALKIPLGVFTFVLTASVINLMGYPESTAEVVYIMALAVIVTAFVQTFNALFQAFEEMEYISAGQVLNNLILFGSAIAAVKAGAGLIGFALLYLASCTAVLVYSIGITAVRFPDIIAVLNEKGLGMDLAFCGRALKSALPFFLSAVVNIIAFRVDMVMLSVMKGDASVGWYSAAYRLMEFLLFVPAAFMGAVYPVLSNFFTTSKASLEETYQKAFKYLSILAFPVAVGTTVLAGRIMMFVYKSEFTSSAAALRVLIWTIPFIFLTYMCGTFLASINRQSTALRINFLCMILNIVMNLALIPKYGFLGAAAATVMTSLLALVLCYRSISGFGYKVAVCGNIKKPLAASIVMGIGIMVFREANLLFISSAAAAFYAGILFLLRDFSESDRAIFRQVFKIKPRSGGN